MFKEEIIKRYQRDSKGRLIVNVSLSNQKFAFEQFDNTTSYAHRDLNEDFADYLYDCAHEIGNNPFAIRVDFPKKEKNKVDSEDIRTSIFNYFTYLSNLSRLRVRKLLYRTFFHISLSVLLLASLLLISSVTESSALHTMMFFEGLTIAAWVFMWPVFSDFMYEAIREKQYIKTVRKILSAEVLFDFH
ncbi:MAG: hypothetical protein ACLFNK_03890 [Candidatus Woesearchaeota archaeon]